MSMRRISTPPPPGEPSNSTPFVIAPMIRFDGELSGEVDLAIEGSVYGSITFLEHYVIVGANAVVSGDIHARRVLIFGTVTGSVLASEGVEVAPSGFVVGDIKANRVSLADGATFNGSVGEFLSREGF